MYICIFVAAVQLLSHVQLFANPWTVARQAPLFLLCPGVYSNSCPLNRWCYLTVSSSAGPFSFCLQSFPSSESFPMSWLFASGGQSIGASTSATVAIVVQSLSPVWLCNPMTCSTPGFPVLHHLPELAQTLVHWVSDVIQPSHHLSSSSPPGFNLSQHQSFLMSLLFTSRDQSTGASVSASVLLLNIQGGFPLRWTSWISLQSKGLESPLQSVVPCPVLKSILQHHSSKASIRWCSAFFNGPTLTSVHDYWKNYRLDYTDICWQSNVSAF